MMTNINNIGLYILLIMIMIFLVLVLTCVITVMAFEGRKKFRQNLKSIHESRQEQRDSFKKIRKEINDVQTLIYIKGNVNKLCLHDSHCQLDIDTGKQKEEVSLEN